MTGGYKCVITWSEERRQLLRLVKNLTTNSWASGTFVAGYKCQFEIVDLNPVNAIWPHKSEDILVQTDPPSDDGIEAEMYKMLFDSSNADTKIKGKLFITRYQINFLFLIFLIELCSS